MISLEPATGFGVTTGFTSKVVELHGTNWVQFAVVGQTLGTITVEFSVDRGTTWFTLDATNLVFTVGGTKSMVWGACQLRAIGSAAVNTATDTTLDVLVAGLYVRDVV